MILRGSGGHMRRREFITLFGGAVVAWPGLAISQPSDPLRRIGVLMAISEGDAEVHPRLIAFQKSLHDLGWIDGRNARIDYRFVVSDPDRIRAAATDLVGLKPDVLVAQSTTETRALLELTRTVPIVSPMLNDPVGSGFGPELREARRQHYWVHQFRGRDGGQVARLAQIYRAGHG